MPKNKNTGLYWQRCLLIVALLVLSITMFAQGRPDALQKYREGRYDEARQICLSELEENPENMESYVVLGWSLIALGRYADAELYANRAYNTVRRDPRIVEILGEAAFYQGKNQDAIRHFTNYINQLPDGSRIGAVYFFLGEIYLKQDKLNHADIAMRTALQYEPNNARWWARLGFIRERLSDWVFALEAYTAALKISPALNDAVLGRDRVNAKLRG
jgi:tetratricopeptide (TPR) repeat protein